MSWAKRVCSGSMRGYGHNGHTLAAGYRHGYHAAVRDAKRKEKRK